MRKIDQLNDAHCLMPDALAEQMPAFNQQAPHEGDHLKRGATYYDVRRQGDVIAFVKIFNPVGSWTWYLTEWNPAERMAFGLVCGDFDEWGDIWLQELEEITLSVNFNGVKIPDILKLERDLHFRPTRIRELELHPGEPATPYDRLRGKPQAPENPLWQASEVTPNVFLMNHPHYLPVVQWRESLPAVTNLMEIRARRQFPYHHDGSETIRAEARVVRSLNHARLWTLRCWENGLEAGKQATYRSLDAATTAAIKWVNQWAVELEKAA